jgi:hypothetical protein
MKNVELVKSLEFIGLDCNITGELDQETFIERLSLANGSGVFAFGKENASEIRERFGKMSSGKQSEEILRAWDYGYRWKEND